jgi:hypothetical protein
VLVGGSVGDRAIPRGVLDGGSGSDHFMRLVECARWWPGSERSTVHGSFGGCSKTDFISHAVSVRLFVRAVRGLFVLVIVFSSMALVGT